VIPPPPAAVPWPPPAPPSPPAKGEIRGGKIERKAVILEWGQGGGGGDPPRPTARHGEVVYDGGTRIIGERARALIRYPAVHASAPRIHKHDVLKPKVTAQARVKQPHSDGHVSPALLADAAAAAARADVIVVCQVNVEDELSLGSLERVLLHLGMLARLHEVGGT
jgi:hypothetical protein